MTARRVSVVVELEIDTELDSDALEGRLRDWLGWGELGDEVRVRDKVIEVQGETELDG